jgi:hypothetical protein
MSFSTMFVTERYLGFSASEFSDFLCCMDIDTTNKVDIDYQVSAEHHGRYFMETSFQFRKRDYELLISSGLAEMDSLDDDDISGTDNKRFDYVYVPLPTFFDNMIKTVLIKSLPKIEEIGQFATVWGDKLDELISIIKFNLERIVSSDFLYSEIHASLLRILTANYYVRKSGMKRWYPIPWPITLIHNTSPEFFENL